MLTQMKAVMSGEFDKVDKNNIYVLTRWASGLEENYNICKDINRSLFNSDKEILLTYLHLGMKKKSFIPYPKKTNKEENKKFNLVIKYLTKNNNYGSNDIQSMKEVILNNMKDKYQMEQFAKEYGLNNNERKTLGLSQLKFDKKDYNKGKQKTLFDLR